MKRCDKGVKSFLNSVFFKGNFQSNTLLVNIWNTETKEKICNDLVSVTSIMPFLDIILFKFLSFDYTALKK